MNFGKLPATSAPSIAPSDASLRSVSSESLLEDLKHAEKSSICETNSDDYAQAGPSKPQSKFFGPLKLPQAFSLSAYKRRKKIKETLRGDVARIPSLESAGLKNEVSSLLNHVLQTAHNEKIDPKNLLKGTDLRFHAILADDHNAAARVWNAGLYNTNAGNTGLAVSKQNLDFGPGLYASWTKHCSTLVGKDSPNTAAKRRTDLLKIQRVLIETRNPEYITQLAGSATSAAQLAGAFGDALLAQEIMKRSVTSDLTVQPPDDEQPPEYQRS